MKNIFINPNTGLVRAGWRILLFLALFIIFNVALTFSVRAILGSLKGGGLLWFVLLGISATLAAYLSRKYVDKESMVSLGLKFNKLGFLDVVMGFLISALIMTGMYFTLLYTGQIQFEGFSWWLENSEGNATITSAGLLIMLGIVLQFSVVAWWEEIAFRGIILQNISKGIGYQWGVILSTILFGLIHVGNPDATIFSTLLIMLITLKLVYAYLKTGQLWLPIGLHLGWNFFQASVFGFASSGHASPSMISQKAIGVDWLSGGEFGAENSILIIPFTFASLFLINWWVGKTRITNGNSFFKFSITQEAIGEEIATQHNHNTMLL
jgi:membrane protease YdiL (CAAX protease family)